MARMPKVLRNTLLSLRDLVATVGPFVLLTLALLLVAYWVLDPTPPRKVVLATGASKAPMPSSAGAMPRC